MLVICYRQVSIYAAAQPISDKQTKPPDQEDTTRSAARPSGGLSRNLCAHGPFCALLSRLCLGDRNVGFRGATGHLTLRVFAVILRRIWALPLPAGVRSGGFRDVRVAKKRRSDGGGSENCAETRTNLPVEPGWKACRPLLMGNGTFPALACQKLGRNRGDCCYATQRREAKAKIPAVTTVAVFMHVQHA